MQIRFQRRRSSQSLQTITDALKFYNNSEVINFFNDETQKIDNQTPKQYFQEVISNHYSLKSCFRPFRTHNSLEDFTISHLIQHANKSEQGTGRATKDALRNAYYELSTYFNLHVNQTQSELNNKEELFPNIFYLESLWSPKSTGSIGSVTELTLIQDNNLDLISRVC